ncbi:magnesium transporter CorA family protein [Haloimpatiens sp. FM7330]|uniref:magnesium transporter CorA family protein n=1 Tax=Haloimpatiens sp. FM7330 TaxID=3298610 RepID=UPI003625D5BD
MKVFDIRNKFNEVSYDWKKGKSNYWIFADNKEIQMLKDIIGLDDESINECINVRRSSKINFLDDYMFLAFNILEDGSKTIRAKELDIFLSKDYVITVSKNNLDILNEMIKDIVESKNCFVLKEKPEPCIILYYILDRVILNSYDIISKLEARADKIEINILKNPRQDQIDELIQLRRQVYIIRKYLNPLRYIGDSIVSNDNSIIDKEYLIYFSSLNKKIEKLMLSVESLVQDLALVREAFESEIANKTNELMKIFTLIATIFLPLNLLTSMHGMNFTNVPFSNTKCGYYYVVILMLAISLGLIYIFKRKKWL